MLGSLSVWPRPIILNVTFPHTNFRLAQLSGSMECGLDTRMKVMCTTLAWGSLLKMVEMGAARGKDGTVPTSAFMGEALGQRHGWPSSLNIQGVNKVRLLTKCPIPVAWVSPPPLNATCLGTGSTRSQVCWGYSGFRELTSRGTNSSQQKEVTWTVAALLSFTTIWILKIKCPKAHSVLKQKTKTAKSHQPLFPEGKPPSQNLECGPQGRHSMLLSSEPLPLLIDIVI